MTTPGHGTTDTNRGLGLASILETVRRRRMLALLPFLFVLTAAASVAFFLPGLWTARAVVLVDRQQIPESFVKPTVTGDLETQLITLSQEILSRPRLARIVEEMNLYPAMRRSSSMDDVVERMRKDIRIDVQGDADRRQRPRDDARMVAFSVSYSTTDPRTAMAVTNRLADLYVQENLRFRERQAVGTSEFLETQLGEVRGRLQEQERRIAAFKEQHMGELPEQREANLRTLERLQQQLQLAYENNRRANERRQLITRSLAEIDQTTGLAAAGTTGPNVTPAETTAARIALLKQELTQLETRYSDKYPDVIYTRQQIAALEQRLATEKKAEAATAARAPKSGGRELRQPPQNPYVASLMQQLDQANVESKATTDEIATLNRQIAAYQRRIENTPRREQELALITRDYETTRELFRSLLGKRGEAGIAADLEQRKKGENFRVIEPAALPERPAGPNRLRLLMIGLVLALGASGLAVVLAEQVDTSYRTVDEVRSSLPVPVLSTIPKIATERDRAHQLRQRRLATAAVAVGLLLVMGSSFAIAHRNEALVGMLTPAETSVPRR
jgi:polysaccharide chain length determinant protein (PEP-CTERM system associated)